MLTGRVVTFVEIMTWILKGLPQTILEGKKAPASIWIVASFTDTRNATDSKHKMRLAFHDV